MQLMNTRAVESTSSENARSLRLHHRTTHPPSCHAHRLAVPEEYNLENIFLHILVVCRSIRDAENVEALDLRMCLLLQRRQKQFLSLTVGRPVGGVGRLTAALLPTSSFQWLFVFVIKIGTSI